MNFNEKLIELRKAKGLSQDELGQRIGVSRQTISKWELAQSYPDFQRLVLLSDYFGMSLDALMKDIDVQDVREKNMNDQKLSVIYDDVQQTKTIMKTVNDIINGLAIFGVVGVIVLILVIVFLR
ncbi:MAG: helix-turn-helix transcriptional regulator [Peptococcaceae bacterium]|nr:helix-turn-helix transcriptional regulator [Peptococcaceae bacterium]MBO5429056.1 helix-turn-helix transcriptional regulator [Peptococcaceae bacterium]